MNRDGLGQVDAGWVRQRSHDDADAGFGEPFGHLANPAVAELGENRICRHTDMLAGMSVVRKFTLTLGRGSQWGE